MRQLGKAFENEEFTLKNALLTSEGIISVLLEKIPSTIFGMNIAITGYGRIAEYTANKLKLLGADVSIFARNPIALTKAENSGLKAHNLLNLISFANFIDKNGEILLYNLNGSYYKNNNGQYEAFYLNNFKDLDDRLSKREISKIKK